MHMRDELGNIYNDELFVSVSKEMPPVGGWIRSPSDPEVRC